MNFAEVIAACENSTGGGSKAAIKEHLAKLDAPSRRLAWYAQNPYVTFYVKKFDKPFTYAEKDPESLDMFFALLDRLSKREITGNAAREAVRDALGTFTQKTAEFIERVIDKDLKGGFSADTYNKVWPTDPVPSWEEQLAEKCEEVEDFEKYVTFPCWADIKYDGTRQFAFVRKGQPVEYRARGGKPSDHLNGLFDEDLLAVREQLDYDFIVDGETLSAEFAGAMNAKGSKNVDAKKSLIFRAFYIMPIDHWIEQSTTITNDEAREFIARMFKDTKTVRPTVGRMVSDYNDMMAYCNQVIDDETKSKAEREGLILKDGSAVYEWKRSYTWVKVKRFYDVDARIVGFYPGRAKSRLENTVGGVNCVAFLEGGERVEFNVGSGFNDAQRADMKANPDKWLKGTHVISYQEITKAKGKELRSLRFCTLKQAFREDKLVEI